MTLRSARFLSTACVALSLLAPAIAAAEDDATVEIARQRFREGVGFYDQHQYEKARLAFLQAYALKPHPSVLLNLAQSELRGGRPADAAGHFTEYLHGNTEASEAEKQEAELGLAAAKAKIGEVTVAVDVSGAQISVDGDDKGVAPLGAPLFLAPGAHTVEARSGERKASKSVSLIAGQTAALTLALKGSAAPVPPVAGTPEAKDPEPEAQEPLPTRPQSDDAQVGADTSSGGRKPFLDWWADSPVAIVGTAVGVVGLGGGIVFAALSKGDYNHADSLKSQIRTEWDLTDGQSPQYVGSSPCSSGLTKYADACSKFQKAADDGDSKKTIAIVSAAVGGVALVGTVVYYFVDPGAVEKSAEAKRAFQARLVPWTSPSSSGLNLVGQF